MNNCLRIKDKIICNQANEYKVGEGNPQKNKKNVSIEALKHEEPKTPWEDSNWLSKKSHPKRSDEKVSVNCLTQKSVGLKKELSKYTHSDIPQLHEEITEKYSDLLGHFHWSYHQFMKYHMKSLWLMNQSNLSMDCLSVQKHSTLNLLEKLNDTPPQGGGYQQQQSKQCLCCAYWRKKAHYASYSICNSRMKIHGKM